MRTDTQQKSIHSLSDNIFLIQPLHKFPDRTRVQRLRALLARGMFKQAREHPKLAVALRTLERQYHSSVQLPEILSPSHICTEFFVDVLARLVTLRCDHVQALRS